LFIELFIWIYYSSLLPKASFDTVSYLQLMKKLIAMRSPDVSSLHPAE
jgi:hypothetical protein